MNISLNHVNVVMQQLVKKPVVTKNKYIKK